MTSKHIVIIWKWEDLKGKKLSFDHYSNIDKPGRFIERISEDITKEKLESWLSKHVKDNMDHVYEFLIHKSFPHINTIEDFAKKVSNVSFSRFGGGEDFIYFKYDSTGKGTGLIDQTGFMAYEKQKKDHQGKFTKPQMKDVDGKLKHTFFDDVWDYYSIMALKRNIYEKHLLFLRNLLNSLTAPDNKRNRDEIATIRSNIREILTSPRLMPLDETQQLLNAITGPIENETDIRNLKSRFTTLLNHFPEQIY